MRVIKFRGKRIDNGEWVYGCCGYGFDQVVGYIMPNMYFATKDFGCGLSISEDNLGNYISDEVALGGFIAVDSNWYGKYVRPYLRDLSTVAGTASSAAGAAAGAALGSRGAGDYVS